MVTPDPAKEVIRAQAAAWLARLQGQQSPSATRPAFRAWFDEDEAHRTAFGLATEIWDMLPGAAALEPVAALPRRPRRRVLVAAVAMAASVAAAIVVGGGYGWLDRNPVYATGVGEQESVVLADGSRIDLNSDSQVTVLYSSGERQLRLDRGEAMFEVRKDPSRPFVVSSADKLVRALGTTFIVRRFPRAAIVTLAQGRLEISRQDGGRQLRMAVLSSGDRATMTDEVGIVIDRPQIDVITAWRNGQVIFEDSSLIDAAREMNRYAVSKAIVMDPAIARLRISGVFGIHDLEQFAISVAALHRLKIEFGAGEIRLVPGVDKAQASHISQISAF